MALIEPGTCMASLIGIRTKLNKQGLPWLLFSNPNVGNRPRRMMTIKASADSGKTWPEGWQLLLDAGNSAGYSCLTMIDKETIGILYEGSQSHLTFQRIKLSDVVRGK